MVKHFLILIVLFSCLQQSEAPKLSRIQVYTPENSSVMFEYAYKFFREGEPVPQGSIHAFREQLMATGLFKAVRIDVQPTTDGQQVDLNIVPSWRGQPNRFRLDGIVFLGFEGIDEKGIHDYLNQNGLGPGSPLLKNSFPQIRSTLHEGIEKVYQDNPQMISHFSESLLYSDFRVFPGHAEGFLIVVCADPAKICEPPKPVG